MNKYKKPLIIFLIAVFINIIGAWAKIMHKPFADTLLTIGMIAQALAVAWAAWLVFSNKNNTDKG